MLDINVQKFLQVIMATAVTSDEDLVRQAVAIFGENTAERQVQLINRKLEPFNFAIKSAICEITGKKFWLFSSNVMDNMMTYPGRFNQMHLEFIRKVFGEIINSEEGYVADMTCINLGSQTTRKIPPLEAETVLREMIACSWLYVQNGNFYMGVRSIGDLMPYFKDSYADSLRVCSMCKDTLFHGYRCEECSTVAHLYCLAKGAKYQKNLKCLGCQTPVPLENLPAIEGDDPVEDSENDAHFVPPRKTAKSRKSQRRR